MATKRRQGSCSTTSIWNDTDHLLWQVDRFLDMDGMREQRRPLYSRLGRPSIDPELIVRMLVIAYSTNYLVNLENAVIMDVEPTVPIPPAETLAARLMINRVRERFRSPP